MSQVNLYSILKRVETLSERVHEAIDDQIGESLPNSIAYSVPHPEINTLDLQKKVVQKYLDNPFLHDAYYRKRSLEESYTGLVKDLRGWRAWVPHAYDPEHNNQVKSMEELVDTAFLTKNGVVSGVNPISTCILGTVTGLGLGGLVYTYGTELILKAPDRFLDEFNFFASIAVGALFGLAAGGISSMRRNETIQDGLNQARYIDHVIDLVKAESKNIPRP